MAFISIFLCMCLNHFTGLSSSQNEHFFDKGNYYAVFSTNNLKSVSEELKTIQMSNFDKKEAFEGALLMKKAQLVPHPPQKLSLFKEGSKKLETAIKNSPNNAEYHFLRFMIQENAPSFLGYNSNLQEDKKIIVTYYKSLEAPVQQAIKNYSKTSKLLTPNLF